MAGGNKMQPKQIIPDQVVLLAPGARLVKSEPVVRLLPDTIGSHLLPLARHRLGEFAVLVASAVFPSV